MRIFNKAKVSKIVATGIKYQGHNKFQATVVFSRVFPSFKEARDWRINMVKEREHLNVLSTIRRSKEDAIRLWQ